MTEEDLSVLRRPLSTALTGFQEAKRAYENGTEEVRRLLLHECCLIYECNVCRNMFRSLANFISHKRIFCCASSTGGGYSNGFPDRNSALIIHDDLVPATDNTKRSRSTGASPVPRGVGGGGAGGGAGTNGGIYGVNGGLSNVIERLRREQLTATATTTTNIPTTTTNAPLATTTTTVLQLERVPTTSLAVYQTLMREEADSMRTEVDEVNNMLSSHRETMLGPDGKALTPSNNLKSERMATTFVDANSDDTANAVHGAVGADQLEDGILQITASPPASAANIMCDICNLVFQTEKTLKLHIQKKHISSAYVFQCPTCSLTFMQPAAVIRHLANEHKKPVRRIRKMRDTILKRCIQAGDVKAAPTGPNKGTSRELKRLQGGGGAADSDNNLANEEQLKLKSTCVFCAKSFERRAALSTHLNSCRAKHESQEETERQQQLQQQQQQQHLQRDNEIQLNAAAASVANDLSTCQQQNRIHDSIKEEELSLTGPLSETESTTSASDCVTADTMLNKMFANLDKQTFGIGLQTVNLNMLEADDESQEAAAKPEEVQNMKTVKTEELPNSLKKIKRKNFFNKSNSSEEPNLANDVVADKQSLSTPPTSSALQRPSTTPSSPTDTEADISTEFNQTMLIPTVKTVTAKKKQRRFRVVPSGIGSDGASASTSAPATAKNQLACRCKICNKKFNALSNLRRHISMFHYRARKFGCKLCDYRAFRRYDIVNHLGFVHKMQGEREAMSAEWVNVHEVHFSKDDVDGDIVLCADELSTTAVAECKGENNSGPKTYAKRGGKRKKLSLPADTLQEDNAVNVVVNAEGESIKRTRRRQRQRLSLPAPDTTTATTTNAGGHKRPIRNRIKTVKKDFVYDLSNLLKTETDSGGGAIDGSDLRPKRRNTLYGSSTDAYHGLFETTDSGRSNYIAPLTPRQGSAATATLVIGAARRLALALVAQGRAASSTLPELPAERPQMRPRRLTATQSRLDSPAGGTIESRDSEAAATRLTTHSSGLLFEDSFLEKIARRSGFRMKPLLQEDTALNTLLQKVSSANNNSNYNSGTSDTTAPATSANVNINGNTTTTTNPGALLNAVPKPIPSEVVLAAPEINGNLHNSPSPTFCSPASSAAATPIDFISYQVAANVSSLDVAAAMLQQQKPQQKLRYNSPTSFDQNSKHFFIEPDPSIPKSSSPPPTPRKRITLMQRLAENKANKNRESLLRSALEN